MDKKIEELLKTIKFPEEDYSSFFNMTLEKVKVSKDKMHIVIRSDRPLNLKSYIILNECLNNFFHTECILEIKCTSPNYENIRESFTYAVEKTSLPFLKDRLKSNYNSYFIELNNVSEEHQCMDDIQKINNCLMLMGYPKLEIIINEFNRTKVEQSINKDLKVKVIMPNLSEKEDNNNFFKPRPKKIETVSDEKVLLGKIIDDEIKKINDIDGEEENLAIEAEIFGIETFESTKSDFKVLTLKITDYTNSVYAKIFTKSKEEYEKYLSNLKEGRWFKFYGYTKYDQFSRGELVFNVQSINYSNRTKNARMDDAPIKRVELHTHTMMSQMDGLTGLDLSKHTIEIVNEAIRWGHKAIAITDHNGCQAFPIAYSTVTGYNKGKDPKDHFKVLYGTELIIVDDNIEIVKRSNDTVLLQNEYVVFDFETTGFNAAGGDSIIEIGAVKLKNGEIIDKFDMLIKPPHPISERITSVTSITNEMVEDCPNEEFAVKEFIKWTGTLPMVAHNAKFDTSFLEMAYKKYHLGEYTNTVIDTLALSRLLDQDSSRHGLSAITKRYGVEFDEESHHRGDYDALATALVFHKMMKKLASINILKISDLDKLVNRDDIHKIGRNYHINLIVQNKKGLKNLFKIISIANTKHFYRGARILRSELESLREGILVGSGCYESEVFLEARSKSDEEMRDIIGFYDYVEVQPPECYIHLIQTGDFLNDEELKNHLKKIIRLTQEAGKYIVATGDVHHMTREDKIYREIIINQKNPGGGLHPLAKKDITEIPSQHFRTTNEMLNDFSFLNDEKLINKIVIENTNKISDLVDEVEVIIDTGGIPFSPRFENSREDVYSMVYNKAHSMYGEKLPHLIEERIANELYGEKIMELARIETKRLYPESDDKELFYETLNSIVKDGYDKVYELTKSYLKDDLTKKLDTEEASLAKEILEDEKKIDKETKKMLGGIIGGGFDVIYLIAQKLVKHSNDEGYLVGSRGSVGSSFVATMMGITEVNPLPAHYLCKNCKTSIFTEDDGKTPLSINYSASGYDLPDKKCPNCGSEMSKEGQDMPFATFLGFNADKVPDIDLNFSGDNQASAHAYTKVIFGEDNVYRAGTIGTVAEKTAFGFVKGYLEKKGINNVRTAEIERLAKGCTGVKRTTGQHPGGIVVIPGYMDVFDFTPFQYPADELTAAWRTTHFDYHAIDQDVLKLDILGHDDPTVLRMLQDLSGIDVTTLPISDSKVLSLLGSPEALGLTPSQIECETGTLGLPELGTNFVINMLVKAKPKTFGDMVKISGLSHGTDVWSGNAEKLIEDKVCEFKEVIGCRDDIMLYLSNHGMKPKDAFKIMEFVRKGKAKKDKEGWKVWKEKMQQAGIVDWYIDSCEKIQYMFPKAHACAYVMSAMRIAWFKVYQPINYYAAYFSIRENDFDIDAMIKGYDAISKRIVDLEGKGYEASNKETSVLGCLQICREATARGIVFDPISLTKSDSRNFLVSEEGHLIPPFRTIDGLGETVSRAIVEEREKREFLSIEDLQMRAKVSQTLIDKLRDMHILDGLPESSQLSLF